MCVVCRAFEALHGVPVAVAIDRTRWREYDALMLGAGKPDNAKSGTPARERAKGERSRR